MNVTGFHSQEVNIGLGNYQATSHYLSQCWSRFMSPYGFTWPYWVNMSSFPLMISKIRTFSAIHTSGITYTRDMLASIMMIYVIKCPTAVTQFKFEVFCLIQRLWEYWKRMRSAIIACLNTLKPIYKMATSLQTTFGNLFSTIKIVVCSLKFH